MATYAYRRLGNGIQRTTISANGTRSNTRTFFPGQRGFNLAARRAARPGASV